MISILLISLLLITLVLRSLVAQRRQQKAKDQAGYKSPFRAPSGFFGINAFRDLLNSSTKGRLSTHEADMHRRYGDTFTMNILGNDPIFTIEPENIKAVLATQFEDYSTGIRHAQMYPLIGDGIFSLDGDRWAKSRALLKPQFMRDQVSDLDRLNFHVDRFIRAVPADGSSFDIQELFLRLGTDTSTDTLFGQSVDSLLTGSEGRDFDGKLPYTKRQFREAFGYTQHILVRRIQAQKFYWLVNPKKFGEAIRVVHAFIDHYVDRAVQVEKERKNSGRRLSDRYVFLEALAMVTNDRKVLRDQLLHILLAGRDTTSSLLSSVFYFLSRDKHEWETLRAHILETFGDHDKKQEITFESLKSLRYLQYVMKEALRLIPPVAINGRVAFKDTSLPVGGGPDGQSPIFVRKGQNIRYSCFAMHRREDIWGADADSFRPERWDSLRPPGWAYIPFNGGPRICLGQQLALTEAGFIIVKLLTRFDSLECADPNPDSISVSPQAPALVWAYRNGVHVRMFSSTDHLVAKE